MTISIRRVWGMVLRYLYLFKSSLDRQTDSFYWPSVDLVLWGITSRYFTSQSAFGTQAIAMVVSGIVLWIMVWRGQYEVTVNILEEIWNKNAINLFVSPLKISEWMISFICISIIKAVASIGFAALLALLLYKVNLFLYGFSLLPFLFLLIVSGLWAGFMVGSLILRFGGRVQQFAWSLIFLVAPFSAIYYPVAALPGWAQNIAAILPTSYLFEGARHVILTGQINPYGLMMGFLLNLLYLAVSIRMFISGFNVILRKGLVKLQ